MLLTAVRYEEALRSVATRLLREGGYSVHQLHHADTSEIRRVVQHLLVIRSPPDELDTDEEILYKKVDEVLELERSRTPLVDAMALPTIADAATQAKVDVPDVYKQIALWKGDITSLQATAIVNAANSALLGCFQPPHRCIDNVIHCKAGPRLRTACHEIMTKQGHEEPVGSAKITPGFMLPAQHVIHTVGPALRRGSAPTTKERAQLASCYTSSLDVLLETVGAKPEKPVLIAFPCISTGLFAFPSDQAVPLAVQAAVDWLEQHQEQTRNWRVIFNTFQQNDYDLYKAHFQSQLQGLVIPAPGPDAAMQRALSLIKDADYLMISAGAGLSAAAGLDYTSEAVMEKFHPNVRKVLPSFRTMYSSIGYSRWHPELMWGYLFKQISIVRYDWVRHRTAPTYSYLHAIRNYMESTKSRRSTYVVTSNADGMFEQEGFPKDTTCLMQGEYGRIQCRRPCTQHSVWDAKPFMEKALESFNEETYEIEDPEGIPKCPNCGGDMFLLLRIDNSFLESALADGKKAYRQWVEQVTHEVKENGKKLAILEVGVGYNTPGVLRFPNEELATIDGVSLIRVNSQEPDVPFDSHGVGLAVDANQVLQYIADEVSK